MTTEKEIKARYTELHDLLTESYYNFHNISKEEFDFQHGKIWADMETELLAEGYIKPPEPSEFELLKGRVKALEDAQ